MTINSVVEFSGTADEVLRLAKEYGIDGEPSPAALNALMAFLGVPEDEREWMLRAISAFVCRECGRPSCLHGYPDC